MATTTAPRPGLEPDGERDRGEHADDQAPVEEAGQRGVQVAREDAPGPRTPAHMPPVVPADRSISPSSSTNTRPMRDDGDVGALAGQVADVVLRQEPVADLGEDDDEDDEAQDRRQRARVTGAELARCRPVKAPRDRSGARRRGRSWWPARRSAAVPAEVRSRWWQTWRSPQMLASAVAGARPRSPLRPAVISSTIWVVLVSVVMTSAATRPR